MTTLDNSSLPNPEAVPLATPEDLARIIAENPEDAGMLEKILEWYKPHGSALLNKTGIPDAAKATKDAVVDTAVVNGASIAFAVIGLLFIVLVVWQSLPAKSQ